MVSDMNVELRRATEIKRNADGVAFYWGPTTPVARFNDSKKLADYIKTNIESMDDVVAVSGSASWSELTNSFIAQRLKEANKVTASREVDCDE